MDSTEPARLAVIAVPELDPADHDRIDRARKSHDPLHGVVPAHFTLMFPAPFDRETLLEHVESVAARTAPIDVLLSDVRAHQDTRSDESYMFLMPARGAEAITRLHDELHQGDFERCLHPTVPYEPHVTIGRHADFGACVSHCHALRARGVAIETRISVVDVVHVAPEAVRTLRRSRLRGGPAR